MDVTGTEGVWHESARPLEYDLSAMPSLTWAIVIGPYLLPPAAVPRSLSKLLLVSNLTDNDRYQFQCDLSSLDLLALITVQEQCHFCSGGFSGPRLDLHEGDFDCDAEFPSDDSWYILLALLATLNSVAEHLTAQVDGHGSHCRCDGGGAHSLQPIAPSPSDQRPVLHADVCAGTSQDAANFLGVNLSGLCRRGGLLSCRRRTGL